MAAILSLFQDMCRLCLDETGIHDILKSDKLLRDILLCTGILHISRSEIFPTKICANCLCKIETAKDLRRYSTKNDLYMKSLLDNTTATTLKISRPKAPLELNKPYLEERVKEKSRISVRSLKDINSSKPAVEQVVERVKTPNTSNSSNHASPEKRQTKTSVKKEKCDSTIHKTFPLKKSKKGISIEKKNPRDGDKLKCDKCKKIYPTPRKLYMHRRTHTKNLFCPLDACGKSFSCKNDLQKHIRSHTGEKPYECDLCEKSFAQNVSLKFHKKNVHLTFNT